MVIRPFINTDFGMRGSEEFFVLSKQNLEQDVRTYNISRI